MMIHGLEKIRSVAVYCASTLPDDPVYAEATAELARYIARHRMTLIFGGADSGLMKILADTALEHGAKVIGVFAEDLPEEILHPGLTESFVARNLAERKALMLSRADVLIGLPGSFGTWDELFDALVRRKIGSRSCHAPIGVLNVNGYFDHLLAFIEQSVSTGITPEAFRHLLKAGNTPEELFRQFARELTLQHTTL